jgi:hypothetical protein
MANIRRDEHFDVREVLDTSTGKVNRYYSFKRRPAKRVLLTSKRAQRLAGYALIEKDLRSVAIWLKEITERHGGSTRTPGIKFDHSPDRATYNLIKGLFVAAVTFYGKCFTDCEGRRVRLDRAIVQEKYREEHDTVMRYRHNFAAHSGAENLEGVEIALVLPPKRPSEFRIYRELWQPDFVSSDPGTAGFPDLVDHVLEIVRHKMREVETSIAEDEILPKGLEYWLAR